MKTKDVCCVSVLGGWQSAFKDTDITFGPVFNKCSDLWQWQADNIYSLCN